MIQLSLRSAASLPIIAALLVGLIVAARAPDFWSSAMDVSQRVLQLGITAFFAAAMGLIFVLPNVLGALAANRFGAASVLTFAIVFAAVCAAIYELQSSILSGGWLAKSGLISSGGDPWVIISFVANVVGCIGLAILMSWRAQVD